jgi:hypothetical protein
MLVISHCACLVVCMTVCLSVCLSACLFVYLFTFLAGAPALGDVGVGATEVGGDATGFRTFNLVEIIDCKY